MRYASIAESSRRQWQALLPGFGGALIILVLAQRPDTAVVVLTSFSDRERILAALDAGAVGRLLEDVESDELARAIHAAGAARLPCTRRRRGRCSPGASVRGRS